MTDQQPPEATPSARGQAKATATLSTGQEPIAAPPRPLRVADVGEANASDQFSAVINVHGCNLQQIEVALANNLHEVDPHPALGGRWVRRHPIYLVAVDYGQLDADGNPAPGAPAELDLETLRQLYAKRFAHVSAEAPPEDGSHVRVAGMHTIAKYDQAGRPTGEVMLGSPDEVPS